MTENELLDRLSGALEHAAPDDVDSVLSHCGAQEGTRDMTYEISEKRKKKFRAAPWIAAACLTLMIAGGGFGVHYQQAYAVQSIVSLDVNPSVELKLNSKAKVLSAAALNSDGEKILEGMDLKGADVNVAMNALVGSLLQRGYVDELANSILISVEDSDSARGTALQEKLTYEVTAILDAASVNAAILTQSVQEDADLQAKAEQYGISVGKAQLIESLVANSDHLTFEALAGLSVNELNLLSTNSSTALPETVQTTGKASDGAYIGVEAAKQAAYTHAGVTASQVSGLEVDFDYEGGVMVYEVEFVSGGVEYDCDVNAVTGAIVKYKTHGTKQTSSDTGSTAQNGGTTQSSRTTAQTGDIGAEGAKAVALKHAGLSESQVTNLTVRSEWDDGALQYEVKFMTGDRKYEYGIAATGAILGAEQERIKDSAASGSAGNTATDTNTSCIGVEAAKTAAYQHAGVSASNVYDVSAESHLNGNDPHYEVEFKAGNMEYEYKIDAVTGAILKYQSEKDD